MGHNSREIFGPKRLVGEWVQVRSREEILATLDEKGCLDGMPFMPEMFAFCGRKFQIHKRAHKTCDTVFPVRGRRLERTIHLETRCDGQGHGGCQAGCLIFWKEAWLKPVLKDSCLAPDQQPETDRSAQRSAAKRCTEADLWASTSRSDDREPAYVCQATQLPYATTDLVWWDIRQYVEDYTSGNVGLWRIICGLVYSMYYHVSQAGIGLGRPMQLLYDLAHPLWRGTQYPRKTGTIAQGQSTPKVTLDLQPGELVRVKSHEEILQTVNTSNMNRGMLWDAELVPYCGGTYKVLKQVTKVIDQGTGKMQVMKNPCIVLDSVVCQSRYSYCRMFCPRGIYSWWREIWLERVEPTKLPSRESSEHEQVGSCA